MDNATYHQKQVSAAWSKYAEIECRGFNGTDGQNYFVETNAAYKNYMAAVAAYELCNGLSPEYSDEFTPFGKMPLKSPTEQRIKDLCAKQNKEASECYMYTYKKVPNQVGFMPTNPANIDLGE